MSMRWSKEALEAFEKRALEYRSRGKVREHICQDEGSVSRSKFGNKTTVVDGIKFQSKREAKRYEALRVLAGMGAVRELRRQVRFMLEVNGVHVCDYIADFAYKDAADQQYVEDCKGYKTDVYRLKKRLMQACFGIEVRET